MTSQNCAEGLNYLIDGVHGVACCLAARLLKYPVPVLATPYLSDLSPSTGRSFLSDQSRGSNGHAQAQSEEGTGEHGVCCYDACERAYWQVLVHDSRAPSSYRHR